MLESIYLRIRRSSRAAWNWARQFEGSESVTRALDDADYRAALLGKLLEEADEAKRAASADLPEEFAHVLECSALTASVGMSWAQLFALTDDKRGPHGGFARRVFLESVQ